MMLPYILSLIGKIYCLHHAFPIHAGVGFVWHPDTLFQPNDISIGTSLVEKTLGLQQDKKSYRYDQP